MSEAILKYIALVGPLPPPFGGMANQTQQLTRLLEAEGLQVDLIRTNESYRPAWVGQVKGVRALFRLLPYLWNLWRRIRKAQLVHIMANSGWSWHLYTAPAIWIAWWLKVPVVINYRGGEAETFFQRSIRWVRPSIEKVGCIAVPSGFLQSVFSGFGMDTTIVPNIIDLERFKCSGDKVLNREAPHIVVCRNLEPIYDVATAVRAFSLILSQIPGSRLSVAGEGPDRQMLEALTRELSINDSVKFTGRLDLDGMQHLYASADLMLNASRVDNMPNALLEAMSAGVPIVTTDAGGIPYMVEQGKTAYLISVGDWKSMGEAAATILSDSEQHANLARACTDGVSIYQWESVKPMWMQVYAETCNLTVHSQDKYIAEPLSSPKEQ